MNLASPKSRVELAGNVSRNAGSTLFRSLLLTGALFVFFPLKARAVIATDTFNFTINQTIPDNDVTGISNTHIISSQITSVDNLQVTLNISGGFNGDLYAYLFFTNSVQQSSAFTVLLNRVGRTATELSGYADPGMNVTFDNQAPNGDIHAYQTVLDPHGGTLSGLWQPDGRNVHPDFSFDSVPRTADMGGFKGLDPNGSWTLFIADDSAFGLATLDSWQIQISSVPEPTTSVLVTFPVLLFLAFGRAPLRNHFGFHKRSTRSP